MRRRSNRRGRSRLYPRSRGNFNRITETRHEHCESTSTHGRSDRRAPHTRHPPSQLPANPEDAERIVVAKNSGRLTAVVRNPDDAANSTRAMSIDDVVPKKPKAANQLAVQYIVGGRS